MIYDVNYFINKFSAIPEDKWVTEELRNDADQCCANGHCGINVYGQKTEESIALKKIFYHFSITPKEGRCLVDAARLYGSQFLSMEAMNINDNNTREYQQPTPKQRILAALHDIKKRTESLRERVVYVAVPVSITEQVKELITN